MKALVLAGGFPQITLIQQLKSRGITTVLADYNKEPVAKKYADIYYQESTQDLDTIERIAREEKVDFLITVSSESALKTVAIVSDRLGLPCYVTEDTVNKITNKAYMKKVFAEKGIPNAKHVVLHKEESISADEFEFPVIVKPADCYSSAGVRKVWNAREFDEAVADGKKMGKSGTVLIEEFLEGIELSVDAFVVDGKAHVLCITNSDKIADDDRFVIYRGNYPGVDPLDEVKPQVEQIVQQVAEVFGLVNSPLLVQMIYGNGRLNVLECSARNGGSAKFLLVKRSCGFDLVNAIINLTLGIKPDIGPLQGENRYVSNEYLYCRPGIFDRLDGFEELKQEGIISDYYQFKWRNLQTGDVTNSGDRVAGFTIQADTKEEMNRKHNLAVSRIRILDVNGEDMLRKDLIGDLYGN